MKKKKEPTSVTIFRIISYTFVILFIGSFFIWYRFPGILPNETPVYLIIVMIICAPMFGFVSDYFHSKYGIKLNLMQKLGMKYYETWVDIAFFVGLVILTIISFLVLMHSEFGAVLGLSLYAVYSVLFFSYLIIRHFKKKKSRRRRKVKKKSDGMELLKVILGLLSLLALFFMISLFKALVNLFGPIVDVFYVIYVIIVLYYVYTRYKKSRRRIK